MRAAALFAQCACIGALAAQVVHLPLTDGWRFRRMTGEGWYPAEVPGVVHTDLLRAGLIPDPYRAFNVDSVQWVEDAEWLYERIIVADDHMLGHDHADLVFEGLDTFADVWLNDTLLGRTDNMFRTWSFPVKGALRSGANTLRVHFRSAVAEGRKLRESHGIQLPHDNDASGVSPYVRKAAYQFGWDFCPRLVTCGIWRPVELRCWDDARIQDVRIRQRPVRNGIELTVTTRVEQDDGAPPAIIVHCSGRTERAANGGPCILRIERPERWWPQGSGEQPLHRLQVQLDRQGDILDTWDAMIGLRTVELDQQADGEGRPFRFLINGKPVFMKGCNLVPPSMFLPAAGDTAWVRLVDHMRRAHMNMVRVWAGGVYPPDAFFTACDTAGILVWQDLMFANMPPDDSLFLRNAEQECAEQSARIGKHPSLALWCGNNELDVAWQNWGWQSTYHLTASDQATMAEAYSDLFQHVLPPLLTDVPYVHTSPLSNWGNAEGLRNGDLHYWGVWHGDSTFASFRNNVGRFVSEYGFQSYPDSALLAKYIAPEALHLGSAALRYRQRSYRTDRPILDAIRRETGAGPATLGAFIAGSQEMQRRAVHEAAEAHMAAQPRCMGTLAWQLNDPWPGPSWSLVDHDGHWKPALFELQRSYAAPR